MSQARIDRMVNEVRVTSYRKMAMLTIVAAVAAVIVGLTTMTSGELTANQPEPSSQASGSFTYFPGQYTNQATEPSEHIQAF